MVDERETVRTVAIQPVDAVLVEALAKAFQHVPSRLSQA
jgi:hypothetical protein